MGTSKRILLAVLAWAGVISAAHFYLNINWLALLNDRLPPEKRRLNVAYIPVT
jgi:NitT/TauT family transport system substrate-binding protein